MYLGKIGRKSAYAARGYGINFELYYICTTEQKPPGLVLSNSMQVMLSGILIKPQNYEF
jgi:hypothetical protein